MNTSRTQKLRRRIRFLTWLFIVGLVLSGASAIPLKRELDWLIRGLGAEQKVNAPASTEPPDWAVWLRRVREPDRDKLIAARARAASNEPAT